MATMGAQARQGQRGPSQEYLLLDYLQRLARGSLEDRTAVHLHLSRLRPHNRRTHHIRIAAATFEGIVQNYEGQSFILSNSDIFFICKGASLQDIDTAVMKVRFLFSEDPLAQGDEEEDLGRFVTWFNLENQFEEVLDLSKNMHRERERQARMQASGQQPQQRNRGRKAIEPAQLAKLEEYLQRADLSNLMRRQSVCAVVQNVRVQPVFQELYISIPDLQQTVLPDYDLGSNKWLFQHLTQTLDSRMLSMLMRNDDTTISSSFSMNLNVSTILSPQFLNFDSSLKAVARGTVVVELQKIDIFADMGAYIFARDFLRERGYRVCLDGMTHLTIQFIDRERLGLDLVKLIWSPDLIDETEGDRLLQLKEHIDRCGRARIILCRCDSEEAIRFGQSLGITMFQGRHVDKMMAERKIS